MNNRIKLLLVCFACLAANCKYEDGPFISFESTENRLTGAFEIESVTEDGVDQMDRIDTLNIEFLHLEASADWLYGDGRFWVTYTDTTSDKDSYFGITNSIDDEEILFGILGCGYAGQTIQPFQPLPGYLSVGSCQGPTPYWKILKLTSSCFWLSVTFNDKDYEVHLIKKGE